MGRATSLVSQLETFDDDKATDAVEALISMGAGAAPALRELLCLDGMTRRDDCDNGERLYYVLKALRGIGDAAAWRPALRCYLDLDAYARADAAWGEGGNPNYNSSLKELLAFAKTINPSACASLPALASFDAYIAARSSLRSPIEALLS